MKGISIFITLMMIFINLSVFAQELSRHSIRGIVKDSLSGKYINEALIIIRSATNSKTFYTAKDGSFSGIAQGGKTLIVISQYGYHTKYIEFSTKDSTTDLGIIMLQSLSIRLNELTVKGQSIIVKVVQDTTEFKSANFELNENALLSELLKRLPGLEVSSDGGIFYNGEKIEKILIDGQEYFGNNIAMALSHLSADLFDKLQIITTDNLAAGTGINTGIEKVKILNLTIKQSQKEKFAGNATLGYGTSDSYIGSITMNRWDSKKQLSIIANQDNINGIQDGKAKSTSGINKTAEVGLNTNFIFNSKNSISASATYSSLSRQNSSSNRREYTNMSPIGITLQENNNTSKTNTINLEFKYLCRVDSFQQVTQRISYRNGIRNASNISKYSNFFPSDSLDIFGDAINSIKNRNSSYTYITEYSRNFKKTRGSFTQTVHAATGTNSESTDYAAQYKQNTSDTITSTRIDNYNPIKGRSTMISAISIISYKVTPYLTLNGFYSTVYNRSTENNKVYNKDPNNHGKLFLIDSLQNYWDYKQQQNVISLGLNIQNSKIESSIKVNWLSRKQEVLPTNSDQATITWNFIHPRMDLIYYLKPSTILGFTFNFEPSTINPSLLITVKNFQNPLLIQSGNPNIKNPIKRNILFKFSSLNTKSLSNFSSILMYSNTNNKIVNNIIFDSLGRQILTPINLDHSRMLSWGTTWSKPFFKRRLAINLNNNVLYANDPVSVSGILGTSESLSITPRVSINYTKKELIDIQSSFSANRTYSTYNIGKITKNEVTSFNMNLDVTGYLPLGFIAGVKYNKVVTSGLASGFNRSVDLLNVFLSKRLLKNKMEIKAQGFDILNNNNSFSRTFTPTYFEDTQSTVLQRFFMGSIIYYIK